MMRKAILGLVLIFLMSAALVFGNEPYSNSSLSPAPANSPSVQISERFEIFAGAGYFAPSLQKWTDIFKTFNTSLKEAGAISLHQFKIVRNGSYTDLETGYLDLGSYKPETSESYISSDMLYNFGMRYFFTNNLNLSLSIAHFKSEASNSFWAENQGQEDWWPDYGYEVQDRVTVGQKLEIFPTVLSLNFNLPISPWPKNFELYGGAGVGFNFSKIKADIVDNYYLNQTEGGAVWDSLTISPNPLSLNIISNIRTNTNPICLQVSAGTNLKFGMFTVNFEVGYNFSRAKIKEDDWRFYTRKFTPIVEIKGRQAPDYEVKYTEERKYYFDIPESAFEQFKVKEIDFSGLMIKGGIGLSF